MNEWGTVSIFLKKKMKEVWECSSKVEHLVSMHGAPGSILHPERKDSFPTLCDIPLFRVLQTRGNDVFGVLDHQAWEREISSLG